VLQLLNAGTVSVDFNESKNEGQYITFDYGATLNCFPLF